ncbi:MAG: hypothetical protein GYB33_22840 [Gammaproteobacteria bacterium]|uniref:hypothetical protein n=1 Tax=Pseudomaricurvus alcaniphilus TaxID=1166482 RepID=UPI00140D96B7|nr:hypothetical protein [Pseudomaricurvus alcaniphilus]MBR9913187.1 hypothetical protein [Gammaproteobacteria bacterium]NHN35769.1 hypothetical protein [Pseudomaricurvus alcaniphilus]
MAKPNYSFEKRQRDIAKKKKKEEKRQRKAGTEPETEETTSPEQSEAIKNIVWPTQDKTE